jgi:hypothetical protein
VVPELERQQQAEKDEANAKQYKAEHAEEIEYLKKALERVCKERRI